MSQLTHGTSFFTRKTFPVTLICDGITFQPNIGAIFRICEAFGVRKIIFVGENIALTPRKVAKTSRSTHLTVPYEVVSTAAELTTRLNLEANTLIALEITTDSIPLRRMEVTNNKPIFLVAGSEVSGVSTTFLQLAHQTVHIDMYGDNSSMNVVQAVAIALYELTSKIS